MAADPSLAVQLRVTGPGTQSWRVAIAGDVNNDGYDDIITGHPHATIAGLRGCGMAVITFGRPSGNWTSPTVSMLAGTIGQSVTLYGVNEYDMFGSTVSAAGDVDGDGIDDVLVSATAFRVDGDPVGRSFLIYGRESWPANMSVSSLPLSEGRAIVDDAGGSFGDSLSSLGDVNNDGYADFAVGAPSRHQHWKGQLQGFLGRPRYANTSVSFTINGNDRNENLAGSIAGVGDVDNDGYHDFVIGAPSTYSSFNEYGRAYLIFGGPSAPLNGTFDIQDILANDQGVRFSTNVLGSWLGAAVAPAGDRNNDGFADFLIGAPWQALDSGPIDGQYDLQAGRVYLICGRARNNSASTGLLDQSPIDVATGSCSQILGSSEEEQLGYTMSPAGSLDGDVYDDFVLSSFMRDFPGMERAGAAYIFRGNMVPSSTSSAAATGNVGTTYRGDYSSLRLGTAVDGGGDVDGDGVPDVLIASAWDTSTSPYLGAAYIVFGGRGAL